MIIGLGLLGIISYFYINKNSTKNILKNNGVYDVKNNWREFNFDNIKGEDLYNTIKNASKIIAFHGMMTNLATIENNPVLDLFYCEINSISDFRRYKNALYEFKPKYNGYDFIVPSKNIQKTIRKMRFSLKKT